MAHLQPYLTFIAEVTHLNALYWSSRYSYKKTSGILKLIADTGHQVTDPRVDVLWGSNESGLSSITTVPLSEFHAMLNRNAESLRSAAILQICSAFENALCGYYALGALYEPLVEDATTTYPSVPQLLQVRTDYQSRRAEIFSKCEMLLKGNYTKRIKLLTNKWGLPQVTGAAVTRLNGYQKKRHLIAHDQGIASADFPERSATELFGARINITEAEWKGLISDFTSVLRDLDTLFSAHVVADGGIALAIYRIVERDGALPLSALCAKVSDEWRTGHTKRAKIRRIALAIGLKIKQSAANDYTVSR